MMANSEDPDLHCFLRQKWFSEQEIQFYLEIISMSLDINNAPFQLYFIRSEGRIH